MVRAPLRWSQTDLMKFQPFRCGLGNQRRHHETNRPETKSTVPAKCLSNCDFFLVDLSWIWVPPGEATAIMCILTFPKAHCWIPYNLPNNGMLMLSWPNDSGLSSKNVVVARPHSAGPTAVRPQPRSMKECHHCWPDLGQVVLCWGPSFNGLHAQ